jgi:hypothetical protein
MLPRIALVVATLCLACPVLAADNALSAGALCRQSTPVIRELWKHGTYDTSPEVAALMVDTIDGKLPQVRRQLATLKVDDAARWRQVAMLTAVWTGQAFVADGLLNDGAAVDGTGWLPPYKPSFYQQTVDAMKRDPRLGGPVAVDQLKAAGVVGNQRTQLGPALSVAVECSDVATVDVLLRHHADVMARQAPNIADALDVAVVNDDAAIVQRLLDHGANACGHDRLGRDRMLETKRKFIPLAEVGRRAGLAADLIGQLNCPAAASAR